MAIRSVYAQRRRWPLALLIISGIVGTLAVVIGAPGWVVAGCAVWLLSAAGVAALAARGDRGAYVPPAAVPVAATLSCVLGIGVLLVDAPLRSELTLLAVAGGFLAGVLLLGSVVVLSAVTDPPGWLRDADGRPAPALQRPRYAARQVRWLAQQRPRRPGVRIVTRTRRDMSRMVWRAGTAQQKVFPYFLVVLHPETVRRLDAWMPIQHMAAELAQAYADTHHAVPTDSTHVVVQIASDPAVPQGVAAVGASFRQQRVAVPVAKAWARLGGLPDDHGLDGAFRYDDSDRTQVLAGRTGAAGRSPGR